MKYNDMSPIKKKRLRKRLLTEQKDDRDGNSISYYLKVLKTCCNKHNLQKNKMKPNFILHI